MDSVEDHPIVGFEIRELTPEEPGINQVALVRIFTQEIDPAIVREVLARLGGLANTPHAEEEEARRGGLKSSLVVLNHVGDFASILTPRQGVLQTLYISRGCSCEAESSFARILAVR